MNINKKYAIIINGDTEPRHLANAELAAKRLKELGYDLYVANPLHPTTSVDQYVTATLPNLQALVQGLKGKINKGDDLVIFTTGHGGLVQGDPTLALEDGEFGIPVASLLDIQNEGQRTVIMDQCFGGNWKKFFVDDPKTLFITTGAKDELVSCQQFTPFFWSEEVKDLNKDGVINFQERYDFALSQEQLTTQPQYLLSAGYTSEGIPPFSNEWVDVQNSVELENQLKKLGHGQYAILSFQTRDEKIAKEANGQYLLLHTQSQTLADSYHVVKFPAAMILDNYGGEYLTSHPEQTLKELSRFEIPLPKRIELAQKLEKYSDRHDLLSDYLRAATMHLKENPEESTAALTLLAGDTRDQEVKENAKRILAIVSPLLEAAQKQSMAEVLKRFYYHEDPVIRRGAIWITRAYEYQFSEAEASYLLGSIRELWSDDDVSVRSGAVEAYASIVGRLSNKTRNYEAQTLVSHMNSKVLTKELTARQAFIKALPRFHPEGIQKLIQYAQESYEHWDYQTQMEILKYFTETASSLPLTSQHLLSTFFQKQLETPHEELRILAMEGILKIFPWLPKQDQCSAAKIFWKHIFSSVNQHALLLSAMAGFYETFQVLDKEQLVNKIPLIEKMILIHPLHQARRMSLKIYQKMLPLLTSEQRTRAVELLLERIPFEQRGEMKEALAEGIAQWASTVQPEKREEILEAMEEEFVAIQPTRGFWQGAIGVVSSMTGHWLNLNENGHLGEDHYGAAREELIEGIVSLSTRLPAKKREEIVEFFLEQMDDSNPLVRIAVAQALLKLVGRPSTELKEQISESLRPVFEKFPELKN